MLTFWNRHLAQPFAAWKDGKPYRHHLRSVERTQFDPPDVIRQRQLEAVRAIVRHAGLSVPFYRDRWAERGLHPGGLKSLGDLAAFPILTKADLRAQAPRLRSEAYSGPTETKTTSGSTGVSITVHVDPAAMAFKRACVIRADQWSGYRFGSRVARLWGHGPADRGPWTTRLRRHLVYRESYLNTLGITEARLAAFAEHLRRKPPGLLFGHAHSLYLFAAYVKKHAPGTIRPDGVISAAMMLHDYQRAAIEEAFGGPVTNRYGCEETSLIACECEQHRGLHLNADSVYCEVVPDPALGPGAGRLLVTDLTNRAMPLIRYQVGDVVVPSTRTCPCGRGLPLIESVVGREADYVLTPAGTLISGISLTDHFATEIRGASQVQIVQEQLKFLRLRMVPDASFGPDSRRQIDSLVANTFGPEMRYELELVSAIPQEPSGKYRFCVSPVATEYIRAMSA